MPQVRSRIPHLINGVSEQSATMRLPTQAALQDSFYSTLVDGLRKRPPTQLVAKLLNSLSSTAFSHIINRDTTERYSLTITTSGVSVVGFDGVARTVVNTGSAYLAGLTDPQTELQALTVADYTFVLNKSKTVLAKSTTSPARTPEALVNVKAGNYGRTYKVFIDGTERASYTVPDGSSATHTAYVDTVWIADQLLADLIAAGYNTGSWQVARYQNAVYIRRTDSTDFTISVEDGANGNDMVAIKGKVQSFSDLPRFGPDGVIVEIIGTPTEPFDNYWVRFDKDESAVSTPGIWRESLAAGAKLGVDPATMPHVLVRQADGSFTFGPATWDDREVGDEETVPDPSFVGSKIRDLFFYKNRLGFLADESALMSRAGSFFNFFRQSLTALLDDDPIDVASTHVKVSILNHAVPWQDTLLLWSDQTQFKLDGNDLLTPSTVNITVLTEYASSTLVRPVGAGQTLFFVTDRGDWSAGYEYFFDPNTEAGEATEITSHVPSFVPSNIRKFVASSESELVAALSPKEPTKIFLYKYYWAGNEKLQSAWFTWTIPNCTRVIDVAMVSNVMYLVVERSDGVYLEYIDTQQAAVDEGLDFVVHLDQRIDSETLAASYSAGTDKTTFTLPYAPPSGIVVVAKSTPDYPAAFPLEFEVDGSTVIVEGNRLDDDLWIGVPYTSIYQFSPFIYRREMPNGGAVTEEGGRTQVKAMQIFYDKTSTFSVRVTPEGREPRVYPFVATFIDDAGSLLDAVAIDAGRFTFPVKSRGDRVKVEIISDSWLPCAFTSAQWAGVFNPRVRQR